MSITVSRFLATAQELLDAAEQASRVGGPSSDTVTVLIGRAGEISLVMNSDWPLESLERDRGAAEAYRISAQGDRLIVEGRAGGRACLLATGKPNGAARLLLPDTRRYQLATS